MFLPQAAEMYQLNTSQVYKHHLMNLGLQDNVRVMYSMNSGLQDNVYVMYSINFGLQDNVHVMFLMNSGLQDNVYVLTQTSAYKTIIKYKPTGQNV